MDIAELIEVDSPKSFCCIFHDDIHPSANIFATKQSIQKYRCASENLTLNIKQLVETLGKFKSEFKAVQFIMEIYNLSIKESQWSIEQRENIDMMINNITLNKFKELCPQADKNIKYAKEIFLMMLSIARNNIYSEKFFNSNGEIAYIKGKGYCTEKEVIYILGNQYKYPGTETQIKRSLNEIMDTYGLKKIKVNKALKEKLDIKSDGSSNIIMEDIV